MTHEQQSSIHKGPAFPVFKISTAQYIVYCRRWHGCREGGIGITHSFVYLTDPVANDVVTLRCYSTSYASLAYLLVCYVRWACYQNRLHVKRRFHVNADGRISFPAGSAFHFYRNKNQADMQRIHHKLMLDVCRLLQGTGPRTHPPYLLGTSLLKNKYSSHGLTQHVRDCFAPSRVKISNSLPQIHALFVVFTLLLAAVTIHDTGFFSGRYTLKQVGLHSAGRSREKDQCESTGFPSVPLTQLVIYSYMAQWRPNSLTFAAEISLYLPSTSSLSHQLQEQRLDAQGPLVDWTYLWCP